MVAIGKKLNYFTLVLIASSLILSNCAKTDDSSSGSDSTSDNITTTSTDTTAPVISEVTVVTTPTNDSTPNYTFSSDEAGTITYGGSCSSVTTSAVSGYNTVTLVSLSDGTYSNCTITVTDSAGNASNTLTITAFTVDSTAPVVAEVTAVTTPNNDNTPNYTFSTDEAGTITYGGSCTSSTTSAVSGNNTVNLISLSDGTYSDCTITVTDSVGNASSSLTMSSFVVDTTSPSVSSTSPSDSASSVSIGTTISVTFSESMDNSSVTANTSNTSCSGSMRLSSNNFSSCIQMSSTPSASNTNKTFSVTPSDNLSSETPYKVKVTTLVKDLVGNSMSNSYTTSNGFTTADVTAPVLSQVTAITTPTNNTTPEYTFSSSEAGTITYGGSCSSSTSSATPDNNTITLDSLIEETYSDCTITVTDNSSNSVTLNINLFVIDTTAATLAEVTAVATPTNDNTSSYTFSSTEAGTISYGGTCSSDNTSATADNNTVTFNALADGTHDNCTINVTDSASNVSSTLNISSFVIDTTAPTVSSIYPTDNQSGVSITDNVSVTFSEVMDNTAVTTNTDNTTCSGSFQLSSDNFTNCIKMSAAPVASNSNKTFTTTPADNLSGGTTYKLRITTSVTDTASNALASAYTSNGFTTYSSGTIKGTVKQSDGNALSDVLVSFSGANADNTTTDSSGDFNKTLGLGTYTLTYTKIGYITTTQSATLAANNQTLVVATLTLLSSSGCSAGNVSGTIKDAVTGNAVSGVSLSVRSGLNVTSGSTTEITATTDGSGNYSLDNMSAGGNTIEASISGYITSYFNVNVCGNMTDQDANMSETLNSGTMRIVVTWSGTEDFDSHLEIPVSDSNDGDSNKNDSTHLWYGVDQSTAVTYTGVSTKDYHDYTDIVNSGDYVTLDTDNTDGVVATCGSGNKCGPETITISKIRSGTYRYHVHVWSRKGQNTTHIADNGTYVQVFYNDNSTTFYPPSTAGDLWTVFDFDVDNQTQFNPLNTMSSEGTPANVDNH